MRGNFITDRSGESNPNYKHGGKGTRLWSIYNNMKTRCYNPNVSVYRFYGARGIKICSDWLTDFVAFREWAVNNGYHDDLTLDRVDVDGDYCPQNCRWVTSKQQAWNTRRNKLVSVNGEVKPLVYWCEHFNINYRTVQDRLHRGWDIELALTSPVQTKFRRTL